MTATLDHRELPGPLARSAELWRAPIATKIHWALRIGVAMEFIGHGMAGLYRAKSWIPYYTFFGFSPQFAQHHLMYLTGAVDILLALLVLFRPMRAVLLHMAFWGLMTAWLRPLTGESWFELVERGANYGMPAALLLLSGWGTWSLRSWFERVRPPRELSEDLARQLAWVIRVSIFLLLVGHGGLGIWAHKPEWATFFGYFGIASATVASAHLSQWVGLFEIALGLAVLIKPLRGLLVFVLVWKVGTELLRPLVGQNNYQFIERGGDYMLPIALFWLVGWLRARSRTTAERFERGEPPEYRPLVASVNGNGHQQPQYVSLTTSLLAAQGAARPDRKVTASGTHSPTQAPAPDPELVAAAAALNARLAAARRGVAARR